MGKTLYVAGTAASTTKPVLTAVDTATNATIATLALTAPYIGVLRSITMAPNGKTVYVTYQSFNDRRSRAGGSIIGVDVASNTELKPISVGGSAAGDVWTGTAPDFAISPDSQTGYLAGLRSVTPVDLRTGAVYPSIPLPTSQHNYGYNLALSPDGQELYMIQNLESTVVPFDTATSTVLQPIRLAGGSRWMLDDGVFAPRGKTLYVLSWSGGKGALNPGRMTPIDVATGTVGKPIDIPAGLDGIVFSP
jgi:DNA-binding beta-propeller fold protein YncE